MTRNGGLKIHMP